MLPKPHMLQLLTQLLLVFPNLLLQHILTKWLCWKLKKKNKMKPSWSLKNGNKIGVTTFSHSEVCDGVGCHCNFKNSTWCDVESSDICYGGDLYNEKLWICKHMEQSLSAKKIREMFLPLQFLQSSMSLLMNIMVMNVLVGVSAQRVTPLWNGKRQIKLK